MSTPSDSPSGFTTVYKRVIGLSFFSYMWDVLSFTCLRETYVILRNRFTRLQALALTVIFPDAKTILDRVQRRVIGADTQEALKFKKSISDDCAQLGVAAAILAQVSITSLGLDGLDKIHWTAKAAFVVSLTTSAMSAYYAVSVHREMSGLFTPRDVRSYFCTMAGNREALESLKNTVDSLIEEMGGTAVDREGEINDLVGRLGEIDRTFKKQNGWNNAYFPSIIMVTAPTIMLKLSLASFIVGLSLYFGLLATSGDSDSGYCTILIVYVTAVIMGIPIYYLPAAFKHLEICPFHRQYDGILAQRLTLGSGGRAQTVEAVLHPEEHEGGDEGGDEGGREGGRDDRREGEGGDGDEESTGGNNGDGLELRPIRPVGSGSAGGFTSPV